MKPPIFVRTLSKEEREALEDGLRSSDAFVLRRCQILLASARGERPPRIADNLGCGSQTVRNAIHAFSTRGALASSKPAPRVPGKSTPPSTRAAPRLYARYSTTSPGSTANKAAYGPYGWPPWSASKRA
ncbi:MAG: helix-turn-helix domain-containing protein [Actinomycetota bacterium]|nr:helix-turn-helix domain-containing protein [Actinomycetota bacterium]